MGDNHVHGESPDHVVDAAVPRGWSLTHLHGNICDFFVDGIEQSGQIAHRAVNKHTFQPFGDRFDNTVYVSSPLSGAYPGSINTARSTHHVGFAG